MRRSAWLGSRWPRSECDRDSGAGRRAEAWGRCSRGRCGLSRHVAPGRYHAVQPDTGGSRVPDKRRRVASVHERQSGGFCRRSGRPDGTGAESESWRTRGEPRQPLPPQGLDINAADVATLQLLPGVGRSLAQRIVAHRESRGPFREAVDLLQVPGIGAKRYARLQGLIRTQGAP